MSVILDRAKKYSAEIQDRTRAQQLAWFGEQLDIAPRILLQLIGYSPTVIDKKVATGTTVEELAEKKPEGTLWVTEILRELVAQHGYEVDRVAKSFREPVSEPLAMHIPTGVGKTNAGWKWAKNLLFRKVSTGGPHVYSDFTDLLRLTNAMPHVGNTRRTKKKAGRRVFSTQTSH